MQKKGPGLKNYYTKGNILHCISNQSKSGFKKSSFPLILSPSYWINIVLGAWNINKRQDTWTIPPQFKSHQVIFWELQYSGKSMYMAVSCTCLQRNGAAFQQYQTKGFFFKGLTKRCNSTTNKTRVIFSQAWDFYFFKSTAEYTTKKRSMLPNKRANNEKSDGVQMTGAIPLLMLPSLKMEEYWGGRGSSVIPAAGLLHFECGLSDQFLRELPDSPGSLD